MLQLGVPPTSYLLYSLRYRLLTTHYSLLTTGGAQLDVPPTSYLLYSLRYCPLITLLTAYYLLLTTYYLLQVERSLAAMVMVVEQLVTHHPNP